MALRIGQRDFDQLTILDLHGKLAGESGEALAQRIDDLIAVGRTRVILNLRSVSFIDSAALGELLSKRSSLRDAGGHLKLLHLTDRVWDLMVTTKLELVFETFRSETEAIRSFGQESES
ncbi:MAG: STAS domain-containing protein [Acidobacteria bacterium]|nr:STAS domain-containing protein [Acidobacteriota bacterium]